MITKNQAELPTLERQEVEPIVAAANNLRDSKAELKRQTIILELEVDEAQAALQAVMAKHLDHERMVQDDQGRFNYVYMDGEVKWRAFYRERMSRTCGVKKVKE